MPGRSVLDVLNNITSVIVEYDANVMDVAEAMVSSDADAAIIVKDEKMIGIVTESDLIRRVLLTERKIRSTQIQTVMTRDTVIVNPESKFGEVLYLMREFKINHIPVVDNGKPIGVISISEALISDVTHYAHDAQTLDPVSDN